MVPGLIPEGVTLLASRPKLGKSWLVLQITTAVANGVVTLTPSDHPAVGDVLYLAWISHTISCIAAANQRKSLCCKVFD